MITNRTIAAVALLTFMAFFAIVLRKVPEPDLAVVVLIGVGLAAYDLWRLLVKGRG